MIITFSKLITGKNHASVNNGALLIDRGSIQAYGSANSIIGRFSHHDVLHLQNAVLMPGLVNSHSHIELPPLLDSIRAQRYSDWVLNLILAKRSLNRQDYASAAIKNTRTIIQTGTTTIGEICTHGVSTTHLKKSGLRAVVFREVIQLESGKGQGARRLIKTRPDSPSVKYGFSPHTPYTVSESMLHVINRLAKKSNKRLAMHIAESKDEVRLLQRKKSGLERLYQFAHWDMGWAPRGSSSFEYLDRIGFLSPRLLAVHAVQVNDEDIRLIKTSKTSVAHCPRSNKELGVGKMPLKKFLDARITVGLGTDSLASSPSLNMWDEMRYAYKIHRQDGVSAEDIFRLATIGGAKALGWDKEIGTIEPGKKADIIAVPLPKKNTGDLYSDLLRETKSCIMTMVSGKILYQK